MKRVLLHIPVLLLLSPLCPIIAADEATVEVPGDGLGKALAPHPRPVIPIPTEGRRLALEAAGAFCNDGFRIRDGEWSSSLTKEAPVFLQLTLFAGNRYWFVAATPSAACSPPGPTRVPVQQRGLPPGKAGSILSAWSYWNLPRLLRWKPHSSPPTNNHP